VKSCLISLDIVLHAAVWDICPGTVFKAPSVIIALASYVPAAFSLVLASDLGHFHRATSPEIARNLKSEPAIHAALKGKTFPYLSSCAIYLIRRILQPYLSRLPRS
jgi:hypothetical protein